MSIILGISESTVNFHIHNAMEKLGENTRIVTVMKATVFQKIAAP